MPGFAAARKGQEPYAAPEEQRTLTLDDVLIELTACGVPAWQFWEMTYREVFAQLQGDALRRRRDRQLALWHAWHQAAFERQKKLPALEPMLRKFEPQRTMSNKELREQVIAMAKAMGALVIRRKKGT